MFQWSLGVSSAWHFNIWSLWFSGLSSPQERSLCLRVQKGWACAVNRRLISGFAQTNITLHRDETNRLGTSPFNLLAWQGHIIPAAGRRQPWEIRQHGCPLPTTAQPPNTEWTEILGCPLPTTAHPPNTEWTEILGCPLPTTAQHPPIPTNRGSFTQIIVATCTVHQYNQFTSHLISYYEIQLFTFNWMCLLR